MNVIMKGLIIKDFLSVKRELNMIALFSIISSIVALFIGYEFGLGIVIFMSGSLSISSFAYDDAADWNRTALSMPLKRSEIVISKYLSNIILISSTTIAIVIIYSLFSLFGLWDYSVIEIVSTAFFGLLAAITFFSILIPLIYKLGSERARMLLVLLIVIPFILSLGLKELFSKIPPIDMSFVEIIFPYIFPVACIVVLIGSMAISLSIFKRKEF